jgi:DNA repair protein RecO (recombination protein O)
MAIVVTDAVVLHAFDYLETSRVFRLATREGGGAVHSVVARGARRPKSRFGTAVDLFAEGTAQIAVRPGREMHNLIGFDISHSRHGLSESLQRFAAASAIAEMAARFARDDLHGAFYDELTQALDRLNVAPPAEARAVGLAAAWRLVAELGFAPTLEHCASCREMLGPYDPAVFSHSAGGVLCRPCAAHAPVGRTLPPEARLAVRDWIAGSPPASGTMGDAEGRAHQRLLREFLHEHLTEGRELRAYDAWASGRWERA